MTREECRRARILGGVGRSAIDPAQIEIALEVFTPSQAEVDRAEARGRLMPKQRRRVPARSMSRA
jgi:citrate lyase beta subunit